MKDVGFIPLLSIYMTETWKDIPGYEGRYKISNFGKIYSHKTNKETCGYNHQKGYKIIDLWKDGKRKLGFIHRLVLLTFVGASNGLDVNHKNGNKSDNHIDNLEYCTKSENMKHSFYVLRKGIMTRRKKEVVAE